MATDIRTRTGSGGAPADLDAAGDGGRRGDARGDVSETSALLGPDALPANGLGHDSDPRKDSWVGFDDFEGLPWWEKPSVWWLLGPYALFTLAFGGSVVPKLNLIMGLICERYFADRSATDPTFIFNPVIPGEENAKCKSILEVQRSTTAFMTLLSVLIGILSSLTAPKLGAWSDRFGRKRMMVICSLGGIVNELVVILAARFPGVIHYNWLILGAVFDGLAGSFTAGSVLSHAYTADCTPPSKRSVSIGYLHACLFTGLAFGPLLGGYLADWTGSLLTVFYVTLGCHILFALFMYFVAPESLSKKKQLLAREKYALEKEARQARGEWVVYSDAPTPFGKHITNAIRSVTAASPFAPLDILFPKGPGSKRLRRNLLVLAFIDMTIMGAAMSAGTVMVLYTELRFGWGNTESSKFISLVSMVRVIVLMGLFPVINYFFRTRHEAKRRRESGVALVEKNAGADGLDVWILRVALVSDVVGITGYIFARTGPVFILAAVITALGGLGSATIQSALSKHVPAERVGQLLGAIGLLHSLARIVFPIIFNGMYWATVKVYPQAFFVLLAGIFALALVASFYVRAHVYMSDDESRTEPRPPLRPSRVTRDTLEDDELIPGLS